MSRIYSTARWQRFRASVLSSQPLCENCQRQGRGPVTATELHHVKPISEGGAVFDRHNVQPLCRDCHNGISQGVVGVGVDGLPLRGSSHWWASEGIRETGEREWAF